MWKDLVAQTGLDATAPAGRIVAYAFTEMLNNAIDHSGGRKAQIRWWATPSTFSLEISDDGEGVFTHLRNGLGLEDEFRAIQELTKGKRTTAPERHTGEGIFFTSKAVDLFLLESGGLRWTVDNLRSDQAVGQSDVTEGTLVTCEIDRNSTRQLRDVFEAFTSDAVFDRTRPVVKLFAIGVRFVSRSEAKRLLDGLERFAEVEVDFTGVEEVGQGFVDELVRVWPSDHPDTRITPTNMTAAVEFMVRRGLPGG